MELYMIGDTGGEAVDNFAGVNYLAHFYLAQPDKDLTFGNYIGDGVKGSDLGRYSEGVQRGIRFHRFIDAYTDSHAVVNEAKKIFYPTQGKFTPVVVDVCFDYFLANNWEQHADESLREFAASRYRIIAEHPEPMPVRSERFYQYMVGNNILEGYSEVEGIRKVFQGMDHRTRFDSNMARSVEEMKRNKAALAKLFEEFFVELAESCNTWISKH